MLDARYLMAIDPSLTCSGWALFSIAKSKIIAVGKIRGGNSSVPLANRLEKLQAHIEKIFETLNLSDKDILICEAPTTMRDPKAAVKVEQVRGIFESIARTRGISVPGRINPRSIHHEVMGLGGPQLKRETVKQSAVQTVKLIYGEELRAIGFSTEIKSLRRNQDIVDALLIGRLGLIRINAAKTASVPMEVILQGERSRRLKRAGKRI